MDVNRPIGLYDSGVGGLSVVREVFRQLPHESVLYFGDTARVPYGPRSPQEILRFNREIVELQIRAGVKLILIACNTSSAFALQTLQEEYSVPILGLIRPGAEAAVAVGRRVGLIATEGTVKSGAYAQALRRLDPGLAIREVPCPKLVPLVESGEWQGVEAEAIVRSSLGPLLAFPPDCLIMGCTHYPHLEPVLRRLLPGVQMVNPAERAVAEAARTLADRDMAATQSAPTHRFWVSGDPEPFYHLANRLFPGHVQQVQQVHVGVPVLAIP